MLKTSFFNKVARHNLERFHSEVLAWIFETFEEASKSFVCYVNQNVTCEQIKSIKVEAETSQTDILIQNYNLIQRLILFLHKAHCF